MSFRDEWKKAKADFEKQIVGHMDKDAVKKIGKGADLGPSLDKFEAAGNYEGRQAAIGAVLKGKTAYLSSLDAADPDDKKGEAAIKDLKDTLLDIWQRVEFATQPPKPGGRSKKVDLFYSRNAAGGLRPKWLQGGALEIKVYLVVDELVDEMIKSGELGYNYVNISAAVNKEVEKSVAAFKSTIEGIDAKLNLLSEKDRVAKVREANEVLKYYKGLVEADVNKVVDKMWAGFVARKAYLKQFKKECTIDIAIGAVTVVTSSVSIAMSWGTALLSCVAIAKAICDIGETINQLSRSVETTEGVLLGQMDFVVELVRKRTAAKDAGEGQKLAKAGEAGKEAATVLLGKISGELFTTVSGATKTAKEYNGKISELEKDAGQMYKKIQEFSATLPSSPDGADARVNAEMAKLHNHFKSLSKQFTTFNDEVQKKIGIGDRALDYCDRARKEDALPAFAKEKGGLAAAGVGLASLGQFVYNSAMAIKGVAGL